MFRTPYIITPKKSHTLQLNIRNPFVFIKLIKIEHGAVSKVSYYQIYREITQHTELVITTKENDQRQNTNTLDEKGIDGKRIYNYRQWLKRFKQYTKKEYEIDIRPLIEDETMKEPNGIQKERHNKIFFGHWDTKQQTN